MHPKDQAVSALAQAGHSFSAAPTRPGSTQGEDERERRKKLAFRAAVTRAAIAALAEAAAKKPADEGFWRLLLGGLCDGSWHDVVREVVKRRGLATKDTRPEEALGKALDRMSAAGLRGLAVELVVGRGAFWAHAGDYGPRLKNACDLYGVDLREVARNVKSAGDEQTEKSAA